MFCYYLNRLQNPKEAAIKAGYSQIFAEATSAKLLSRIDILEYLDELATQTKKSLLEQAAIAGLSRLAFGMANDSISIPFLNEDSLSQKLPELDLYSISEFKRPKENSVEIKFFDRFRALEKLLDIAQSANGSETLKGLYSALENSAGHQPAQEVIDDDF